MIGKKIGVFSDFFHISPPLTKWIVMAALQDEQFVKGGGYGGDIDDDGIDFYKKKLGDMNHIIVTMARGKLIVQLGIKKPLNNANPEDPIKHFINTKITYAIDMSTLDVYNSQY
jgi:hypothetical protein